MRTFAQKPKATQQTTSAKSTIPGRAHFGQSHEVNSILHLQRTIGNQAVQRLLQTNAEELEVGLIAAASSRFGHDFSHIPIHPPAAGATGSIQTKLLINKPGDEHEREPNAVRGTQVGGEPFPNALRRKVGTPTGVGHGLDPDTRAFMEPRFGHDFSHVRVHTDAPAALAAHAVGAAAFTSGRHISFAAARYDPDNGLGRALLAHELAHVVQQTGSGTERSNSSEGALEVEADAAADSVSRGEIAPLLSAAQTGIQRRVEMRGVGRGEASGLPRLPELIERLNAISSALIFSVTDTVLSFVENPYGTQTEFDRQMIAFIGDARILPLRLTTGKRSRGTPSEASIRRSRLTVIRQVM